MVKKGRIDNCEICDKGIDNSYRKAHTTCGDPECLRQRRNKYNKKAKERLKKEHKCYDCLGNVELVAPKPYYPTRCSKCKTIRNSKQGGKTR